jgi:F-type H+-transporting ATPase subunit a
MSGKRIINLILAFIVIEIICLFLFGGVGPGSRNEPEKWFQAGPVVLMKHGMDLEPIGKVEKVHLVPVAENGTSFFDVDITTVKMMGLLDLVILFSAIGLARSLRKVPNKFQGFVEIIVEFLQSIIRETLGKHAARHIPTVITLFFFVWFSNLMGMIPLLKEPTSDLNVPLGLMLVMLFLVHYEAIRVKGIKHYVKEYFQPFFVMFPLNVIGEMAKGVSLSFRLFGNICGGAIIIMVVSFLVKYTVLPVGLNIFFGLFVGTIQAFVFTMLSTTYIAVAIAES